MDFTTSKLSNYSPGILSMLPLLYIGWVDGILSPRESRIISNNLSKFPFLSREDKIQITRWTDPSNPPTEKELNHWKYILLKHSQSINLKQKESLLEMGLLMAKICDDCEDGYWTSEETRIALIKMQEELGINDIESINYFNPAEEEEISSEFNIQKMIEILDDDFHEFKNKIRTLLSYPEFQLVTIKNKEKYRSKILEWCKDLTRQNLGALAFPKEYGGENSIAKYSALFEVLGYHDLSLAIKFGVQFGLFGGSVLALGTKNHHDQYLKDIGKLNLPGCFAMTETGHGSNVRDLKTIATYDMINDQFVIHSPTLEDGKEYIGNALDGKMATVFAQLVIGDNNHGVHAFLVPLRNENYELLKGIKVEDCGYKLGLNGVDNGRIWFDHVRIPRANLLNRFGDVDEQGNYSSSISNPSRRFFTMLGTLVGGRVCVPRAGLSAAKTGLTIAIRYANIRRQFSPKPNSKETILLDYPSHQKRLIPLLAKSYALDFALTDLIRKYASDQNEDMRKIESLAAGLKAYSTWFTTTCLQECREACGGKGYLHENRFADLKADTDIFTTFEGDNTVLMQLVGKGILSNFSKEFHDDGFYAVLKMLSKQVSTSVTERNPFAKRNEDKRHLRSAHFQLAAFRYRERKLLYSVSQRMRAHIKQTKSSSKAFMRCQNHILKLAEAHIERIVLENFVLQVKKTEDYPCKVMLKKLCQLFALHTIEKHKGFYLEAEYMSPNKTKAIRREVEILCADIRMHAVSLTESFNIPDEILKAPIAL